MLKAFGTTFLFFLLALPSFGWARCGDLPGDAAALADARAAIEATCSCSGLPTHGAYVACDALSDGDARAVSALRPVQRRLG
jgi:hypothetical protein